MKSRLLFVAFGAVGLVTVAVMAASQPTPAAKPAAPAPAAAKTPMPLLTEEDVNKICYMRFQEPTLLKSRYDSCLRRHTRTIGKPLTRGDRQVLRRLNKQAPAASHTLTQDDANKICHARFQDSGWLKGGYDSCLRRNKATIGKPMTAAQSRAVAAANRHLSKTKKN